MTVRTICLHGPESTGKSTLGVQLAAHFGAELVPEYGRAYSALHGNDMDMAALLHIARAQEAMADAAKVRASGTVILDTDPLMTAIWADLLVGVRESWFDAWTGTADLYLLPDIDLPWQADSVRLFGGEAERRRFFDLCRDELDRRGVRWATVRGTGAARMESALEAIGAAFTPPL